MNEWLQYFWLNKMEIFQYFENFEIPYFEFFLLLKILKKKRRLFHQRLSWSNTGAISCYFLSEIPFISLFFSWLGKNETGQRY